MRRRLLLRLGLAAIASALAATSCLSPTLPLPPPDVETSFQSADPTKWIITGTCAPGALVIVFNDETGQGVAVEDRLENGKWVVELQAEQCDRAWVSQEHGNDASSRTTFFVDEITIENPGGTGQCD